jgi:hypothetical protein
MHDRRADRANQFADADDGADIEAFAATNRVHRDVAGSQLVPQDTLLIAERAHFRSKPFGIEMRREVDHRPGLAAEAETIEDEQDRVRQTSTRTS